MSTQKAIGQIVCDCGHVAEVRRRKNGQKLPYKQCKHCGLQQGKESFRQLLLEKMTAVTDENPTPLGTYGEKPEQTSSETLSDKDSEALTTSTELQVSDDNDWKPSADLSPEAEEKESSSEQGKTSTTSKSGDLPLLGMIGLGVAAVVGLAFFKTNAVNTRISH